MAQNAAKLAGVEGENGLGILPVVTPFDELPGGDLVSAGLRDLQHGVTSPAALLVSIARSVRDANQTGPS
jgi:hypothetical protein